MPRSAGAPALSLDSLGKRCPYPVIEARRAMDRLRAGQVLEVWADDPAAEEDFKAWSKNTGNPLLGLEKRDGKLRFLIRKASGG